MCVLVLLPALGETSAKLAVMMAVDVAASTMVAAAPGFTLN